MANYLEYSCFSTDTISAVLFFEKDESFFKLYATVVCAFFCGYKVRLGVNCSRYIYKNREIMNNTQWYNNMNKQSSAQHKINKHVFKTSYFNRLEPLSFLGSPGTKKLKEQKDAAIVVQKYFKGNKCRESFLPTKLFPSYFKLCKSEFRDKLKEMPRAVGGGANANVYLPEEVPEVVLKEFKKKKHHHIRFYTMQFIRKLLNAQKSLNLIIPEAFPCNGILVEERLPVSGSMYKNMELYYSNPELFDDAVGEMTRLFSEIYIDDFVSYRNSTLCSIGDGLNAMPIYDNLPFSIKEKNGKKVGKINLVDLEHDHIEFRASKKAVPTLIMLFPKHSNTIIKEAKRLKMDFDNGKVEKAKKLGSKILDLGYVKYVEWLESKQVYPGSPIQRLEISGEIMEKLQDKTTKEILKLNQGINSLTKQRHGNNNIQSSKDFLVGDNVYDVAKDISKKAVACTIEYIQDEINKVKEIVTTKKQFLKSYPADERTMKMECVNFNFKVCKLFRDKEKVDSSNFDFAETSEMASQVIICICDELVKNGVLFDFRIGNKPKQHYFHLRF